MRGREAKGAPSADLLVCFPSRAHLTLMPKPICSPARLSEPNKRHKNTHHRRHHSHHSHRPKKSTTGSSVGQASPLLWAKDKQMGGPEITEPTSPKVTCAGQIKVRHKRSSCKSWQSVMQEIEKIHNNKKHKKKPTWVESIGFKKEIMQFLTCLRRISFDFRCFGAFPHTETVSTDDDDDEEEEECQEIPEAVELSDGNETPRTVFSKWFMVLQENQSNSFYKEERNKEKERSLDDESIGASAAPPPNALLLMRCRSAPAKSWLEEKKQEEHKKEKDDKEEEEEEDRKKEEKKTKSTKNLKTLMEEEKRNNKEDMVVMTYDTDFYKISSDIAKETWVVGGMKDLLSRSRSWKR